VPRDARGNYKAVDDWCYLKDAERRSILERKELVHTEQEEIMLTLKEVPTQEPILY
jgi:hypothetical protein